MDERILELWARGWTAGQIATELRITRNAVAGYIYRARLAGKPAVRRNVSPSDPRIKSGEVKKGLAERKPRAKPRRKPWSPPVAHASELAQAITARPSAVPLQLTVWALPSGRVIKWHADGGCAWYEGEAGDPRWCNAPVVAATAWCERHYRLTHTRVESRVVGSGWAIRTLTV